MNRLSAILLSSVAAGCGLTGRAQPFQLPTANRFLFESGAEARFLVGTVGKPWTTGGFGCVRTEGWQMHEGIDIRGLQPDRKGEPTDPVRATADGVVVYLNAKPGLSNYGRYAVLRHQVEGIEVFSLYAHLREILPALSVGKSVAAGEAIAVMGRSSNTRQGISKDRAHVHFELNLLANDRFASWHKRAFANQRNDHGLWNGQNFLGLDPKEILLTQARPGRSFSLLQFIRNQPELCRVLVRDTSFPWLNRYPVLIRRNPSAEKEGVAGFEIALNYNGVPFQLVPRSASEIKSPQRVQLLSVQEAEYQRHPCRRLVVKRGQQWELTGAGNRLIDLLTY